MLPKLIIFLSVLIFILLGIPSLTYAQENITFPISELGNCNNVTTCKVFCDQRENHDACIAFAKAKGFYKETVDKKHADTLPLAKSELGCSDVESCKKFCEQKVNQAKCQSFAQKHWRSRN